MDILIIIGLILLNGVFSMSEIAVISSRRSSLSAQSENGSKTAKVALELADSPDRFLSTVQIGITLIGILTGMYSGEVFAHGFSQVVIGIGIPEMYAFIVAKTVIILVVTYFTIVFGELVPKRIGMLFSEKVAKIIAYPMRWISIIASPFVWLLAKSTRFIVKIFNIKGEDAKVTEKEIKNLIKEGLDDGEVQQVEQYIVDRVFSLGDRDLESIMTYRREVEWIDVNWDNEQLKNFIAEHPQNFYPVTDKNKNGDVLGIVYLKRIFGNIDTAAFDLKEYIQVVPYYSENMDVYDALDQMRSKRVEYAFVCDDFGAVEGLVDMRDIFEALIGKLLEPQDEPQIVKREDGTFLIDGQCHFYEFLDHFGIADLYEKYDYNTLSGLILALLEHVPHTGEVLAWNRFTFEIVDMDGRRIDKVLVTEN